MGTTPASRSSVNTWSQCATWLLKIIDNTTISSLYTTAPWYFTDDEMRFSTRRNAADAFLCWTPSAQTGKSVVTCKRRFRLPWSTFSIYQYPNTVCNVGKILASPRASISSSIHRKGYKSLSKTAFGSRLSTKNFNIPTLSTRTIWLALVM